MTESFDLFNILAYILVPILTAVLGGCVGAYFGSKFQEYKEEKKMSELRGIAIKALTIIRKYAKQSYKNAEDEFNTSLTITDKRCIIVLLHKLGIPVFVPANERFDIHRIHFANLMVDSDEIDGIILQIQQKHCDHLFFLDAETYFSSNLQFTAIREVGKKYVKEVLSKINKRWIVSYDMNDLILKCYSKWNMIQYQLLQCTSNCKKNEILVFSNGLEFTDPMKQLAEAKVINKCG